MDASRKHARHVSFNESEPQSPPPTDRDTKLSAQLPELAVSAPPNRAVSPPVSTHPMTRQSSTHGEELVSRTHTKSISPPPRSHDKTHLPAPKPSRPVLQRFYSMPNAPSKSPARHHFRLPNAEPHQVKETPRIQVTEDMQGMQFINQYRLVELIGRGSYGMVYRGLDPATGITYAIKECSKLRLAKMNRHAVMQQRRHMRQGGAADLIRREVAVMKKLDHPNLVTLYEVLDDAQSDSLYLVLEWCGNGTIMPPERDYDGKAESLLEEQCRLYFRDIILGVEYLHARGVCHRDIKADNVLLGDNDIVKLADFGVSEIFDVSGDPFGDTVRRCVGSPAYMSPELVKLNRGFISTEVLGTVSGRKTDIWAMGVTLYYMLHGHLPFEADNIADLFQAILHHDPVFDADLCSESLRDLLSKLFAKNPEERIRMAELRNHPWVTANGTDELLPEQENILGAAGDNSEAAVTEEDLVSAIEMLHLDKSSWPELSRSLRVDYGWRGSSHSSLASTLSPSTSRPSMQRTSSSESTGSALINTSDKMEKITRALDEIVQRRWWVRSDEPEPEDPEASNCMTNSNISAANETPRGPS